MTLMELLSRFRGYHRTQDGYLTYCPVHPDQHPSLSLTEKEGKILLHCFAGCSVGSIISALGLSLSDLFVAPKPNGNEGRGRRKVATIAGLAAVKKFPVEFLKEFGLKDIADGVLIPYHLKDGSPASRQRVRSHLEHVKGWCWWTGKAGPIVPYGLDRLQDGRMAGYIVLVEGESDRWTLAYHGFPVLGIPGAEMVRTLSAEYLQGILKIFVLQEADAAGTVFQTGILRQLQAIGWEGETRIVSLAPAKDVSELHCADPEKFKRAFQVALDTARRPTKPENGSGFTLTPLGELLARPDMPIDYLLDGCLVVGTVSGVFAKPKVGKGTLARNLCLAVSRGADFLGLNTKQGECIYLALEEREEDIKRDFRAMGAEGTEPILIHAAAAPAEGIRALCDLVREHKPRLVVIDPIIRLARIKDEKAYAETYAALGPLIDAARETGAHIMLLHHSGKSVKADTIDSPLGSTGYGAVVSTLIALKRTEAYRTIKTVQRIGPDISETVLEFDPETKRLSIGETREEAETHTLCDEILELLRTAGEPKTEPEITEAVEGKTRFVRRALRQLVEQGKVSREGGGKRGDPYRYSFSFSCSHYIAGTREQETQEPADTRMNTERKLVPALEQKSFLVPTIGEERKESLLGRQSGKTDRSQDVEVL